MSSMVSVLDGVSELERSDDVEDTNELDRSVELKGAAVFRDTDELDVSAKLEEVVELEWSAGLEDTEVLEGSAEFEDTDVLDGSAELVEAIELEGSTELSWVDETEDAAELDGATEVEDPDELNDSGKLVEAVELEVSAELEGAAKIRGFAELEVADTVEADEDEDVAKAEEAAEIIELETDKICEDEEELHPPNAYPHRALVDILSVERGTTEEDVFVEVEEPCARNEETEEMRVVTTVESEHDPKRELQPMPQYALVYLQQFPNELPRQEYPLTPPQLPSRDTAVGVDEEVTKVEDIVVVLIEEEDPVQSPYPDWQPTPQTARAESASLASRAKAAPEVREAETPATLLGDEPQYWIERN
ncbi:hypothetical protein BKA66DRAFT_600411 [Pyrenochaeta sp. MPI-SDFR-AT-0127]|nr:hypothetical protein BKA66DRAFT_600411 [Pyrenochaeta sp. MPI-SDFR-AT-0127]